MYFATGNEETRSKTYRNHLSCQQNHCFPARDLLVLRSKISNPRNDTMGLMPTATHVDEGEVRVCAWHT